MLFALIDCNNFYVSCERAFNPLLEKKPVIVLSNNDGCIISRSNEAKKLKIPMGAPFYQWKAFCKQHHVYVFSSNYELYGDMSQRIMSLLKECDENMEIYSIDEAFLHFPTQQQLSTLLTLRKHVKRSTGIPISIGIGPTKTLAKIANHIAKTSTNSGVFLLPDKPELYLSSFPIEKIWGVGYKLAKKLTQLNNINTALKLRDADPKMIRLHFSVTLEKTVQELKGIPCLTLEKVQPRKQIISSRSFGKKVTELFELEEAISHYTAIATKKLRKQKSIASALYVFLQTNNFSSDQQHDGNGMMYPFPAPTDDSRYLIHIAKKCLQHLYKKGFFYHKAGIMLLDLSYAKTRQYDLLTEVVNAKSERVMQTMDNINEAMGKNTIFIAAEGIKRLWKINCSNRSSRYTTRWDELPKVFCS